MRLQRWFAAGLSVFAISCIHSSQNVESESIRHPAAYYNDDQYDYFLVARPDYSPHHEDLSFAELEKILSEKRFSKIEDLLTHLKKNKPVYMKHFALGFSSRSLHHASKENPRAIVYGLRGNFVMTFNGHRDQNGYALLEVTEFNHDKKEFEYREIEFNEFGQLDKPYIISEIDGPNIDGERKCLQCHSNRRPIWDRYDVWPGFYGAYDDFPIKKDPKGRDITRFGIPHPPSIRQEWVNFQSGPGKKGRYASLDMDTGPSNSTMSLHMTFLNTLRIAELIRKAGGSRLRYALLYTADCYWHLRDRKMAELQPDAKITKFTEAIEKRVRETILNYEVDRLDQLIASVGLSFSEVRTHFERRKLVKTGFTDSLTLLKAYLDQNGLDGPAEVNIDEFLPVVALSERFLPASQPETWSMALFEGVHAYNGSASFVTFRNFRYQLRDALFTSEEQKSLFPIELTGQDFPSDKINYCRKLADRMQEVL